MNNGRANRPSSRQTAGFSMIEMMLVLALIGLIMGAVVVTLRGRALEAQKQIARMQIGDLGGSILNYRVANGGDCPSIQQWVADKTLKAEPKDPWGHSLHIVCPGEHDQGGADIVSPGPDGRAGNADDIQSWQQ